ncbi:MAG: DUF6105 family protein [Rhizobiaceae bacterium]|nr:DUF6105 family protein [Rhizobiaceae bacterium]MCV0405237.1 DUF6105 family protein [Rhizobiaceae bacterium]
MKYLFALWAAPLILFWGWFGLSYYNIHFGYVMLSRPAHDLIFQLYGDVLGIDPGIIPGMVARACILDTFIILGIWAFRRRREIRAWWERRGTRNQAPAARYAEPAE